MAFHPRDVTDRTLYPPDDFYPGDRQLARSLLGVLITRQEIEEQVHAMAADIAGDYEGRQIQPVVIMEGAQQFYSLLQRCLTRMPLQGIVGVKSPVLLEAKSYHGAQSGTLSIRVHPDSPSPLEAVTLEDALIVEDIEDSQQTLSCLLERIQELHPASLHAAVLLRKLGGVRKVGLPGSFVRYCGFEIANQFVVGAGLDFNGQYRGLDHVCVLHPAMYASEATAEAVQ